MPYPDSHIQQMVDSLELMRRGTAFVRLERKNFRWVVVKVSGSFRDVFYTQVAGPFWRKSAALVALEVQKALKG